MSEPAGDTVELRRGRLADADAIRLLTREAYTKWVSVMGREPLPMSADYLEASKKHRFDLLLIAGTLAALIETASLNDHVLIVNVAVLPTYQGRGFGKRLIDHAEQLAASGGYHHVKLYTNKLMETNLTLYRRLGYEDEWEEEFSGGVRVHMTKTV